MNDKKEIEQLRGFTAGSGCGGHSADYGISRASAYELVHTPGFPAFRRGRLIKVSKIAFFEWMAKGSETVPRSDK